MTQISKIELKQNKSKQKRIVVGYLQLTAFLNTKSSCDNGTLYTKRRRAGRKREKNYKLHTK